MSKLSKPDSQGKRRDYKKEYRRDQKKRTKYRSKLNQERRKRGIYGKGGKEISHSKFYGKGKVRLESKKANRKRQPKRS